MQRQNRTLTLGELMRVVSECSRANHETGLAVMDLMQRGVIVRARPALIRPHFFNTATPPTGVTLPADT